MSKINLCIVSNIVSLFFFSPFAWSGDWMERNVSDGKVWTSKEVKRENLMTSVALKSVRIQDIIRDYPVFHWVLETETRRGEFSERKVLWEFPLYPPRQWALPPESDFPRDFTIGIAEDKEHLILVYLHGGSVWVVETSLSQETKSKEELSAEYARWYEDPKQHFNLIKLIPNKGRFFGEPKTGNEWMEGTKIKGVQWQNETWNIKIQYGKGIFNFYWDKSKQSWIGKEEIQ